MITVLATQPFKDRQELFSELAQKSVLAVDTESAAIGDRLLGIALAWSPQDSVFITPDDPDLPLQLLSSVPTVYHNVLYDVPLLQSRFNLIIQYIFDTMLAAQSCGYHPALGDLSIPFDFNHRHITDLLYDGVGVRMKVMGEKRKRNIELGDVPIKDIAKICSEHAMATYKVWEALKDKVPESYHLDMSLLPLIMKIHTGGVRVNTKLAQQRRKALDAEVEYLRGLCEGMDFNPASPLQVGLALSHEGLTTYFNKRGQMVTDEEALMPLMDKSPIVPLVLRYRDKSKLCSTYIKPLCNVSRVYPRYHIVRTGRFAGTKPNPQNIPEEQRDLYLPDEGDFFLDFDAHQIEPRIMAYFSGDKQMIADVTTGDIYQPIADRYHIERYVAKQLVLASSYGAGVDKLVETARRRGGEISPEDAQALLFSFFADYSTFKGWCESEREGARGRGYVTTILGRKRTLESMMEDEEPDYDPTLKVVNTIVQGTASDMLKLGMKRVEGQKVSLHVHDEILISTDVDVDVSILDNLSSVVPVVWGVKRGENWGAVK